MRILAILGAAFLLSGCESVFYLDSDSFDPGRAPYERFVADSRSCEAKAIDHISYDIPTVSGTSYNRHRVYNRVYAACMTGFGYAPRSWIETVAPAIPHGNS